VAGALEYAMHMRAREVFRVMGRAGFTPSASPSMVMAGTAMRGCAASPISISSYRGSPAPGASP
jgi:hypothetical protein